MSAPPSPSGEAGRRTSPALLIVFILLILAIRLVLAGIVPLTEDEAYYRLWSQAPALGYFDHPPMISWWIWLGRHLVGDTALGVRLGPSLGCALTSLLVFDLARSLGSGRQTAGRAVVWYNATLLVAAGGFLAVPDSPAALFWMLSLCAAARAWNERSSRWWLAAGLAAGLASLSKYSSLFLGPGVFLWLASSRSGRDRLRTPGPWLAVAIGAAVFAPNVAWNATHHWLTFSKQFGRIAPHRFAPKYLTEFLGAQLLLLNPLIAIFIPRALADETLRRRIAMPAVTSAPFVAYLLVHSLHDRVQAHWPAPLYAPLAIVASVGADDLARRGWRTLRTFAPVFGLGACAAALLYLALPSLGVPLKFDPAWPLQGWRPFDDQIETARRRVGASWIGTTSYGLTAQLLDQGRIAAPVMQISERERWEGLRVPLADMAGPGLVVDLSRRVSPTLLRRCFSTVIPLGDIARAAPGERGRPYTLVLVSGPRRDIVRAGCGT
ncbi:MAG TPA: glycosyltransferase family 39 protein [Caulobacteraceae bacterium]|jgi:4-amino-4-deoxy-L-arabinose transferase-like glycosyltransferase|nr:glycosyltransferase family 39 protein [Caulobacteraceae bacterium]